jgi:hypothetical protein
MNAHRKKSSKLAVTIAFSKRKKTKYNAPQTSDLQGILINLRGFDFPD